jgi:hypothetical protein
MRNVAVFFVVCPGVSFYGISTFYLVCLSCEKVCCIFGLPEVIINAICKSRKKAYFFTKPFLAYSWKNAYALALPNLYFLFKKSKVQFAYRLSISAIPMSQKVQLSPIQELIPVSRC